MLCNFEICITRFTLYLIPRLFWRWYWGGDDPPPWWYQSSELCQLSQVLKVHCNPWLLKGSENFSRQFYISPNIAHHSVPKSIVSVVFPVSRFGHLLPCSNVPRGIVCKVLLTLRGGGAETPKLSWCVADVEVCWPSHPSPIAPYRRLSSFYPRLSPMQAHSFLILSLFGNSGLACSTLRSVPSWLLCILSSEGGRCFSMSMNWYNTT